MRGWEEGQRREDGALHQGRRLLLNQKRDENMIPPLPSICLSARGVALSGQTNRQPMIKRVGGLLPGGQGLFKPIDLESYAKVIKQLLVFAILGLEQRVTASQFFFLFRPLF